MFTAVSILGTFVRFSLHRFAVLGIFQSCIQSQTIDISIFALSLLSLGWLISFGSCCSFSVGGFLSPIFGKHQNRKTLIRAKDEFLLISVFKLLFT